ncbi:MAG TPA: lipoyl synthase, partial [Burkholderiaceae bacterium]
MSTLPSAPGLDRPAPDAAYDAAAKQKGAGKTSRIPIKVVAAHERLPKPDWIRVR